MKKEIIFLLGILTLYSCNTEREDIESAYEKPFELETETDSVYRDLRDFTFLQKETNTDTLISIMTRYDCVYGSAVGIGGAYTEQYAAFERLTQLLDEGEIYKLTSHKNPLVRLYAFFALEDQKSTYLERARKKLNKDTSNVCTFSGCIKMTMKVSDYVGSLK